MKIEQQYWDGIPESDTKKSPEPFDADLVLTFGARNLLEDERSPAFLQSYYPGAHHIFCSTSGEIFDNHVFDDSICSVAMSFDHTPIKIAQTNVDDPANSYQAGVKLANELNSSDLRHVLIFSDGQTVNGSQLTRALNKHLGGDIRVSGGLAGDADRFEKTVVGYNQLPESGVIVAVGFYGDHIRIESDSYGGWDVFGPERMVTKSKENILYELDGKSALDLYKLYLGDAAEGLPASALLFPLSIKIPGQSEPIVRTILNIDEESKSMIFAGDLPEGSKARLMKANFERLIEGAGRAAHSSTFHASGLQADLALLISCVGRKLILGKRIEEEVERVIEQLPGKPVVAGFYSYGEIAPFNNEVGCEFHNQSMTVTLFTEL
jgi:hypothetical protein